MTNRGAGCWEIRLSGSKRGWSATLDMDEISWHRWETRRQTENTNFILCLGESPAYSHTVQRISPTGSERQKPTQSGHWKDLVSNVCVWTPPRLQALCCLAIGSTAHVYSVS